MSSLEIAVIGGGASGTLAATRILESLPNGRVTLVEPSSRVGRGAAYGTMDDNHLLNVRAANMTSRPEDPLHFVKWLESRGFDGEDVKTQFVPRKLYGEYLQHGLMQAAQDSTGDLRVEHDTAVSLRRTGNRLQIRLASGGELAVDKVVLALGNLPAHLPSQLNGIAAHSHIVANPWPPNALSQVGDGDSVLFIGTGLTMVDSVLTLVQQGHEGPMRARSRRALLPHTHTAVTPVPVEIDPNKDLIPQIIEAVRDAGDNWRGVVDALRPRTVELWQSLSWKERNRFRNRLQIFWDVHRHRVPPEAAMVVAESNLQISKGGLVGAQATDAGLVVEFATAAGREKIATDWVVNCTGPSIELQAAKLPLLESALADNLLEYDPLGLGLMVDDAGRTNAEGNVWALGPLCRGCRLETTAIPEIRVQAARLATEMAAH